MFSWFWGNSDEQQMVAKAKREGGWIPRTEHIASIIYATPMDEWGGATPIKEDEWFRVFQPLLLEMANTDEGRELLKIPARCGKIEKFCRNAIHWKTGAIWITDEGFIQEEWESIFHVGAYWGNIIRMNWTEFRKLAKTFYEREYEGRKIYRPVLRVKGELVAAHATATLRPDVGANAGVVDPQITVDGYTYNNSSSTWATVRGAATGSGSSATAGASFTATARLSSSHGSLPNNYIIYRSHQTVDTSSLTSSAVISAAYYSFSSSGGYDQCAETGHTESDRGYTAVVEQAALGDANDIVVGDYDSLNTTELSDHLLDSAVAALPESNDFSWTFNAAGISNISKTGITGFGEREGHDIHDDAFVHSGGGSNAVRPGTSDNLHPCHY